LELTLRKNYKTQSFLIQRDDSDLREYSDRDTPNIELSKTMRVQLNIAEKSLVDFLIESGDTQ